MSGVSLGGWIGCLIIGLLLYYLGPEAPGRFGAVLHKLGIVFLVIAGVLFVLWLVFLLMSLVGGGTASVSALAVLGAAV